MSILVEGISLVIENRNLSRYPGGLAAFVQDCGRAGFCSDRRISRVSFLCMRDTDRCIGLLRAAGLTYNAHGQSGDVVLVDQNVGLRQACIWLEFGRSGEIPVCWHAGTRPGRVHVPAGWYPQRLPAYELSPDVAFPRRLRFIKTEDRLDWYQDKRTGDLLCLDGAFVMH